MFCFFLIPPLNWHHTTYTILRTHAHGKILHFECFFLLSIQMMWCDALLLKLFFAFDRWYTLKWLIMIVRHKRLYLRAYVCLTAHHWHPQPIDRRIKSAIVDTHVISLLRRLTLYTSTLQIVDHIKLQSSFAHYCELITNYKSKEKCKHFIYNLNRIPITCATATRNYSILKNSVHKTPTPYKMKDLVNGNTMIENDGLIVDQKSAYHNGVSNGDR